MTDVGHIVNNDGGDIFLYLIGLVAFVVVTGLMLGFDIARVWYDCEQCDDRLRVRTSHTSADVEDYPRYYE